ncbi:hypothetical protein B0H17DRAFT_1129156 [Mycena rosella]|uniref:Uncharacterized protein n=1 Tax=Mycena rosella TaxID=1033263 RepID=A0AAD7DUV7_MYCRO|nr:hypothetical protein B0H17DRAFT_1129156 [Mycena rosella]
MREPNLPESLGARGAAKKKRLKWYNNMLQARVEQGFPANLDGDGILAKVAQATAPQGPNGRKTWNVGGVFMGEGGVTGRGGSIRRKTLYTAQMRLRNLREREWRVLDGRKGLQVGVDPEYRVMWETETVNSRFLRATGGMGSPKNSGGVARVAGGKMCQLYPPMVQARVERAAPATQHLGAEFTREEEPEPGCADGSRIQNAKARGIYAADLGKEGRGQWKGELLTRDERRSNAAGYLVLGLARKRIEEIIWFKPESNRRFLLSQCPVEIGGRRRARRSNEGRERSKFVAVPLGYRSTAEDEYVSDEEDFDSLDLWGAGEDSVGQEAAARALVTLHKA